MREQRAMTDTAILTIEQAAQLFQCDAETAAGYFTKGLLPGVKIGRKWTIPTQALYARLNELALEEAARRRAELEAEQRAAQAKGHALLMEVPASQKSAGPGRRRRSIPTLPSLPAGA